MADTYTATQETEETLARTVVELRHSMLIAFLWATALTHVAWYYFVAFSNHRFYLHTVILILLIPTLYAAYRLNRRHEETSAWLLLGSIALLQALVVERFPSATALALGVLGVVAPALRARDARTAAGLSSPNAASRVGVPVDQRAPSAL